MPNIRMLDLDELKAGKLRPLVNKALRHRAPDPAFHAMLGHSPDIARSMYLAWGAVFNTGRIDHKLKEIVRVQLSRMAACRY